MFLLLYFFQCLFKLFFKIFPPFSLSVVVASTKDNIHLFEPSIRSVVVITRSLLKFTSFGVSFLLCSLVQQQELQSPVSFG